MNVTKASLHTFLSGHRSISLYVAGGIIIATVILTCCCTLCVRYKCGRFFSKFTGKRKKEKYFPSDIEEGQRKKVIGKKLRKKKKKKETYPQDLQLVEEGEIESAAPVIIPQKKSEETENGAPITCYKCYRKKQRRKRAKKHIR